MEIINNHICVIDVFPYVQSITQKPKYFNVSITICKSCAVIFNSLSKIITLRKKLTY